MLPCMLASKEAGQQTMEQNDFRSIFRKALFDTLLPCTRPVAIGLMDNNGDGACDWNFRTILDSSTGTCVFCLIDDIRMRNPWPSFLSNFECQSDKARYQ